MISYDICLSRADLLHSVWQSLGPSILLQMYSYFLLLPVEIIKLKPRVMKKVSHIMAKFLYTKDEVLQSFSQREWSLYKGNKYNSLFIFNTGS